MRGASHWRRAASRLLVAWTSALVVTLACAGTASAQTDASTDGEARRAYDLGRAAFAEGAFDTAVTHFRRAYLLSARAGLLYNIGQAELRGGHDARALEAFEAYLRQAPADDVHRGEVEERARMLREMSASVGESAPVAEEPTPTEPPEPEHDVTIPAVAPPISVEPDEPPREREDDVAPWIVLGVGAAVLVGGAISMGFALAEASRVTSPAPGTPWSMLEGAVGSAEIAWPLGLGLVGVGAAAVAVGLVWALVPSDASSGARASVRVGPFGVRVEGVL
ncbi:MAG: hypothetical protein J0L92_23600 [Deltaproteobacteria bacterium]|nr:hypothetical protein [Deltaproteobacteria bacterium]